MPIFDLLSRQDGLELPSMEELREGRALRVEDAMRRPGAPVLHSDETLADALARLQGVSEQFFLVSFPTGRWAGVQMETLLKFASDGKLQEPLRSLLDIQRLPRLHPDQSLDLALRLLRDRPYLPVVHRADARRLEGILSLSDVISSYRRTPA